MEVTEVAVELVKIIHYNSISPRMKTRERTEHITVSQEAGVAEKSQSTRNIHVTIPPVSPTNVGTCNVISLFYEIHVIAKVGAFHRDTILRIPITIGTIPLLQNAAQNTSQLYPNLNNEASYWNAPSTSSQQMPMPAPMIPNPSSSSGNNDLPPSYHEAVSMTLDKNCQDNDEGLAEQLPFNPQYPVYNFANYGIQPPHTQPQTQQNYPMYPPQPPPNYYQNNSNQTKEKF